MYNLTRRRPLGRLLVHEVPLAGAALIVAEVFYKFHSFTLECLAFLATWFVFDLLADRSRLLRGARASRSIGRMAVHDPATDGPGGMQPGADRDDEVTA